MSVSGTGDEDGLLSGLRGAFGFGEPGGDTDPLSLQGSQEASGAEESRPPTPIAVPQVNPITSLPGRQELAIRRFTQYCTDPLQWGVLLFHTVGTGKTIVSMLMALNTLSDTSDTTKIIIVAPMGIYQKNFLEDLKKLSNWREHVYRFVDYPIDKLISDINNKKIPSDFFENSIVIIDEGHRLLQKNGKDSEQAGADTDFHPTIMDTTFNIRIRKAKRVIIMTGTPLQADVSDIAKLLNFVSKSEEFTLEKYAPITVSTSLKKTLVTTARDFLSSSTVVNLLTAAGAAVGTAAVGLLTGPTAPVEAGANTSSTNFTQLAIGVWVGTLAVSTVMLLIKGHAKEQKALSVSDKYSLPGLPLAAGAGALAITGAAAASLTEGPLGTVAGEVFATVGGVTTKTSLVKLITAPIVDKLNELMEVLNEPQWDMKRLAEAASPHMSIYDPIVQKELKKDSFSRGEFQKYLQNPTSFSSKVEEPTGKSDFPKKTSIELRIPYTDAQLAILEQMYIGQLTREMKRVLYLNEYELDLANASSKYNFIRKFGRMIGNFSQDVYNYLSIINPEGTKYIVEKRKEDVPDPSNKLFGCPKFDVVLERLVHMRKTGKMEIMETTGEGKTYTETRKEQDQPHLCDPSDIYSDNPPPADYDKQYLPLVYSYTELYGTALFAAYLTARGYSYILLHSNQSEEELAKNIDAGKKITYSRLNNPGDGPLCVIIHPKFTEGYDFKHNPAIFTLEPCNTVGDQLQVHGRIFRRYDKPLEGKVKTVNECVCIDPEEGKPFSVFTKKYNATIEKIKRTNVILTTAGIAELFRSYKFISPDAYSMAKLRKESVKLVTFENSVYGGASGDIAASHYCLAHTEHPVSDCSPLNGRGCGPKSGNTPLTNIQRQGERKLGRTEVPSPESHTWQHVQQKLENSGLKTQKAGRRTRRKHQKNKRRTSRNTK